MRIEPRQLAEAQQQTRIKYRHVLSIAFADDGTDTVNFTDSSEALVPDNSPRIDGAVTFVGAQSHKYDAKTAVSSIGGLRVKLYDIDGQVSVLFKQKLDGGEGLRGKRIVYYQGVDPAIDFANGYAKRFTYVIDSVVSYKNGEYTLQCSSAHRLAKRTIFNQDKGLLSASISDVSTTIPVTINNHSERFALVKHDSQHTDRPNETVGYIRIEDEIIAHSGWTDNSYSALQVVERGALSTRASSHTYDPQSQIEIVEYIYLEGAAPKVIYALLTGDLLGTTDKLPPRWHCGVDPSFVDSDSFSNIGGDLWDVATDKGKIVRIIGESATNGKSFIESQLLMWMPGFLATDADGRLTLRRSVAPLPYSDYVDIIDDDDIISVSDYMERVNDVVNRVNVKWGWVDIRERFARASYIVDQISESRYGAGEVKEFEFRTVFPGRNSDSDLQTFFDQFRDRYSAPPLTLTIECAARLNNIEQGDLVRVRCSVINDYRSNGSLDRVFEVQSVTNDYTRGRVKLTLFGSSEKASFVPLSGNFVLQDAAYQPGGTKTGLGSVLSISNGVVQSSGTLTGDPTSHENAIYVWLGDLEIPDGVTVTITENVQLRVGGYLTVNGKIDGAGRGIQGGVYNAGTFEQSRGPCSDVSVPATSFGWRLRQFGSEWFAGGDVHTVFPLCAAQHLQSSAIKNPDGSTVTGLPQDIRGAGGSPGNPVVRDKKVTYPWGWLWKYDQTVAHSANGGRGGAGLVLIVRGMALGAGGQIDLSGTAAANVSATQFNGANIWPGLPTPGYPGSLVVLIDGAAATPILDNVIVDLGSYQQIDDSAGARKLPVALGWSNPSKIDVSGKGVRVLSGSTYISDGGDNYPDLQTYQANYARSRHIMARYVPPADNGYRWFPQDEVAQQPGYGPEPVTWSDVIDDGKKPEDNANLITGTSQLADDAGLGSTAQWPNVTGRPSDQAILNSELVLDVQKTVTVGPSGDYVTIGDALTGESAQILQYSDAGNYVEVRILSGVQISEQITLRGGDYSNFVIRSDDPDVLLKQPAPTINNAIRTPNGTFTAAAFLSVLDGAVGPIIDTQFKMQPGYWPNVYGFAIQDSGSTLAVLHGGVSFNEYGRYGLSVRGGGVCSCLNASFGLGRVHCHNSMLFADVLSAGAVTVYGGAIDLNELSISVGWWYSAGKGVIDAARGKVSIGKLSLSNVKISTSNNYNILHSARNAKIAVDSVPQLPAYADSIAPIKAADGSSISIPPIDVTSLTSGSGVGFTVLNGSMIRCNGSTGTTNVTPNSLTANGVIYK